MSTTQKPQLVADIPAISHAEASELGTTAYVRIAHSFGAVAEDQWSRPTDCAGWTVRDLGGHLVGAMRSAASLRELASQQVAVVRRTRRGNISQVDALTAIQIERAAALSAKELVAACRELAKPAGAGRGRMPALMRRIKVSVDLGYTQERWSLGYLNDVILTRDAWLHRIDLHRALGTDPAITPEHDGRIVADIVAEWARRHGQPFTLVLTGVAGGTFTASVAEEGERYELDAVEFCRVVSGRAPGIGLLTTLVPF